MLSYASAMSRLQTMAPMGRILSWAGSHDPALRNGSIAVEVPQNADLGAVMHLFVDEDGKDLRRWPRLAEMGRAQHIEFFVIEPGEGGGHGLLALSEVLDCPGSVAVWREIPKVPQARPE